MSPLPIALTRREQQILDLVTLGMTSPAIAGRLGLSVHTVRVHRAHLLVKLRSRNTAELIAAACAAGLTGAPVPPKARRA